MTALEQHLEDYLRLRRSLGHDLAEAGRLLPRLVDHMHQTGAEYLTIQAALAWALDRPAPAGTTVYSHRMTVTRGFARYMTGIDPRTEVPPLGLVPMRRQRRQPYIYTPADIQALMTQAGRSIPQPLRAATHRTLIGLLAATGMRVGEALRLDRGDIDWAEAVLLIRESKFGKSRNVPLHPSTTHALKRYARTRQELCPAPSTESFFVSLRGTRVIYETVWPTFRMLSAAAGIGADSAITPRIHDLRHTFAVRTLIDWYAQDADIQERLAWLSAYLGHRDPRFTYWYLSATPELLGRAAARLQPAQDGRS